MTSDRRVLVVDDDAVVRELLGTVLRRRALLVDEAADGRQAIDLIRENDYGVIILDLLMPVADGFAVLDALESATLPSTPVVLVLTGADRRTIERVSPQRVHGIVKKPFDAEELASLVVACAEIRGRTPFGTMAIAMLAGSQIFAWLSGKI